MNSKRLYSTKIIISIMLILSMIMPMIPVYAMTGEVVLKEAHVTSWDELVAQFGGAEANKVIIPEGTTVYVDRNLVCKNGGFTITGGGTLKRGDSNSGLMFDIQKDGIVTIDNIIIDGARTGLTGETSSAVSMISNSSLKLINGTVIKNNNASGDGGAIHNFCGDLSIGPGCKLENNSAEKKGSALYMVHGNIGKLEIDGAEISNNTGDYAISFTTSTNDSGHDSYKIASTKIVNNTGGGIELAERTPNTYDIMIKGCEISGNTANEGAGLSSWLAADSQVIVTDCTFENNIAESNGGAIYSLYGIKLSYTNILNNTSTNGEGGGIYSSYKNTIYVQEGLIKGNKSSTNKSDSIYTSDGTVDISGGATINGSISAKNIFVHGLVNLEGEIYKAYKYTIIEPLNEKSIIEVGITEYDNLVSGTDGRPISTNEIYPVAEPAAGYTISEQDFNCFKINGKSGHPAIDENYLGLYMGDELSSLEYWYESIYSKNIVAWKGNFTISWDKCDYTVPKTTTIEPNGKIILPNEPTVGNTRFKGWFTEVTGGTQITEDMVYTKMGDSTYYAHWNNAVSTGYSIYGDVTNNGKPLAGAKVELYEMSTAAADGKQLLKETITDTQGVYKFKSIYNGKYSIKVNFGEGKEEEVTIAKKDAKVDFNFDTVVAPSFNISGSVKSDKTALAGVNVELYTITGTAPLKTKMTNIDGQYKFEGIQNGQYKVKVAFIDEIKEEKVSISGADVVLDFNMFIGSVKTFNIYGSIKNDKGQPLENVVVNLLEPKASTKLKNTTTGKDGYYRFEGLNNGSYIVEAIGADNKATKTAVITNSNIEVHLEIATKKPVDPGTGGGSGGGSTGGGSTGGGSTGGGSTGGGSTGGGSTGGGSTGGGGTGGGTGGGSTGGGTGGGSTGGGGTGGGSTGDNGGDFNVSVGVKPTPPTENKPTPILPIAPEKPISSEPIPYPTDEPSDQAAYEEDTTEPVIETPDIEEPAVPEEDISEKVVGNEVSDEETTGASNSFMETFKKILLVAAISLLGLITLGLLWLILFAWYRRVKIFNNINTDEYKEDEWSLIHKAYVKKEDKGIYYIVIPEKVVKEFVTNNNEAVLKNAFVQRHHGDIMMIRIEDTDLAYSARIDNSSNIIKFNYDDFKVEEE